MLFVIIARDDYGVDLAEKLLIIAGQIGNKARRTQFLRRGWILGPGMRDGPAVQTKLRSVAAANVFINSRPSRRRESLGRVSVDDRPEGKGVPISFAQANDSNGFHQTAHPPSTQM